MRNRVREQRTQRGLSQAELAAALGVSRQTVISIEGGRYLPSLPLAFAIARFFDMTVDRCSIQPTRRRAHDEVHPAAAAQAGGHCPVGTAYAAAWLVHGGNGWQWAIVAEVCVIALAIGWYVRGGRDNDEDALAGSRADERQQLLALRSWALAGKVAMFAAFAGVTIAVAARADWWWPFAAIFAVTGFGYLLGLSNVWRRRRRPGR